jgi:uroporphyrinogen decarboxylase
MSEGENRYVCLLVSVNMQVGASKEEVLNSRERFDAVMHYKDKDRCPIVDFGFWEDTFAVWRRQGLPDNVLWGAEAAKASATDEESAKGRPAPIMSETFFGMDTEWRWSPINCGLFPGFECKLIEDRGDSEIVRDTDGVTKERGKFLGSIPKHIDHLLKDRASWTEHFLPRLDGHAVDRNPADWTPHLAEYNRKDRDYPLGLTVGSLYGGIRDWMGMDNLSLLVYDDPMLFEEMVTAVTDCVIASVTPSLEAGVKYEFAQFWEDMCYRSGPLLSPKIFEKVLVPNYRRITSLLNKHGLDIIVVDCDGEISKLLPLWLECGVNCMFPIEVGVWGADPVKMRAQYGRDLRLIGGVGKRLLASSHEAITHEVERLAELVDDGGYIPLPDHRVPPDVPYRNYVHYLREARRVWGKNLPNLKPMQM